MGLASLLVVRDVMYGSNVWEDRKASDGQVQDPTMREAIATVGLKKVVMITG